MLISPKAQCSLIASYWTLAGDIYPLGPSEISPYPLKTRIEIAAKAGFTGLGLDYSDLMFNVGRYGYAEMARMLEDHGMRHLQLEYLVDWYHQGERRHVSNRIRQDLFKAAGELGARTIKIGPGIGEPNANIPLMQEEFACLALEAAVAGTTILLEIAPYSNVYSIDTAVQIVQAGSYSNGKILLDIWHICRGGIPFAEVAGMPQDLIGFVEINDADRMPAGSLWNDTICFRRLPGFGSFDVERFVSAVRATGYSGEWGVEILSAELRKRPLGEVAKQAFDESIKYLL